MKTRKPLVERFREKYVVDEATGCWLWTAYVDASGYGRFQRGPGVSPLAHRFAYEHHVGPIPDGLTIDHLCRTRHCVNPAHMETVTMTENVLRGESFSAANARKQTCSKGHELTGENVRYTSYRGRRERICVTCDRARKRAYKQRQQETRAA